MSFELGWFYDPDSDVVWRGTDDSLTAGEVEGLAYIAVTCPEVQEHQFDQRRLEFARYLAKQGIINEFPTE